MELAKDVAMNFNPLDANFHAVVTSDRLHILIADKWD
jgi:hypothetical protein